MKQPHEVRGAANERPPPFKKVAIFSDAARDASVVEEAQSQLAASGYTLVKMLFGLKEIDEFLLGLKRAHVECPDVIIVDLNFIADSAPGLYQPQRAVDRYFGNLVPAGLALAVRAINACIRVVICSEASPEEDPIVKMLHEAGLVKSGRFNPRGPVIFFPKNQEWTIANRRLLREEGRVCRVKVGGEPLRYTKRLVRSIPIIGPLVKVIYPKIPFKHLWAGDRHWVYVIPERRADWDPPRRTRYLLRATSSIIDYPKVLNALLKIDTLSRSSYKHDLGEVAKAANQGGRRVKVLLVDDTPYQRSPLARKGLQDCDVTECTSAAEAITYLSELRKQPRNTWPDVVLCDLYMPGHVKDGELRPRNDRDRGGSKKLLPLGFAVALAARGLGLRVGICTDLRDHHNDRIVGLLGDLCSLTYFEMMVAAGGVIVCEANNFCVRERFLRGIGFVNISTVGIHDTPHYWRGKLLRRIGRGPRWLRKILRVPAADSPLYDCFDIESGRYRTTVPSSKLFAVKDWGGVLRKVIESPVVHWDLQSSTPEMIAVLAHFGIRLPGKRDAKKGGAE